MFKNKIVFHSAIIGVIALSALFTALLIYANLSTVPKGVWLNDRAIEKMPITQVIDQMESLTKGLLDRKVTLQLPHGQAPAQMALSQAGLTTNAEQIAEQLNLLRNGSIWERAAARWRFRNTHLQLQVTFSHPDIEQFANKTWPNLQQSQPVNAERILTEYDQITYKREQYAYRVDTQALVVLFTDHFQTLIQQATPDILKKQPKTFEVPLKKIAPEHTEESLRAQGVNRKIMEFTTHYPSGQGGRVHNIQSTAAVLDMTLLAPNEVFDYEKIVEKTRETAGFKPSPVIMNGKLVQGIGGGICQVSTTLYNAILRSGLEVVERRNHSLPISYAPLGQDATFATGYINFRFKNNTDNHLLIHTETTNNTITVKLFGDIPEHITYQIESKVVRTIEPPTKYVRNNTLKKGQEKVIQRGKAGYVVRTIRKTLEHGKVVKEEQISEDIYKPHERIVAINNGNDTKPDPQRPKNPIIEDGVFAPVIE